MQSERENGKFSIFRGEMAEWSIAAVLKTVEVRASGGSNPSLSANKGVNQQVMRFTPFITPKNIYWRIIYINKIGRIVEFILLIFG